MSLSVALAPPFIYVVAELTTMEPVVSFGPETLSTSPLIAVTLPPIPAGTTSIVLARVASVVLTEMCTPSPTAMSVNAAL
jgi:hypothetical protein